MKKKQLLEKSAVKRRRWVRIYLDYLLIPQATYRELGEKYGYVFSRCCQIVNRLNDELITGFGLSYNPLELRGDKKLQAKLPRIKNCLKLWSS